jgi:DNA-binding NarL/FixJ family response regulator
MTANAQPTPQPAGQGEPLQLPKLRLTERELQVAYFVAQDLSDEQIARRLVLSIGTVKSHIYFAKNKLNVRGRVGLAAWYFRSYGFPPY